MRCRSALGTLAILFCAAAAFADDHDRAACLDAHAQAQLLRRQGKLRAARQKLVYCAARSCPTLVSHDCTSWLNEVSDEQPSVVVVARDGDRAVATVRVTVDGEVVAQSAQGTPIDVDPGQHLFRYELPDGRSAESTEIIAERDKARVLRVDFAPTAKPQKNQHVDTGGRRGGLHVSTAAWVLAGVGVVALGSWAYFGLTGLADESSLSKDCSPNCKPSQVDTVKTQYAIADASLATGVVAWAVAAVLVLTGSSKPSTPRAGTPWFDVSPTPRGIAAGFRGAF